MAPGGCGPSQRGQCRFPSLSSGGGGGGAADRKQGGSGEQTEVNTITFYRHPRWHRTPPLPPPPHSPPTPQPADGPQVTSRARDIYLFHFFFSISLHLTISSSTPCNSCTISRTRQADVHDSESQFKCDYASWRGPIRIIFFFAKSRDMQTNTVEGGKIFNLENKTKKMR